MATLVCFHAHPDDEAISTGGTMAAAVADGHRVVLVCATRGELGEVADGVLRPGESLADRRTIETEAAALILGVDRVAFLGYSDSGMIGLPTNDEAGCFWQADVEEAAARLAAILTEEDADVLTVYDDHGGYGHPDHIQVHRVGVRAAELAGTGRVYEATMNRDHFRALVERAREDTRMALPDDVPDVSEMGTPEAQLTTCVDVSAQLASKRMAMRAHASQIAETSFFLAMPEDAFAESFGTEWFVRRGVPTPVETVETSLFESLD
ncbi:MAG TPA: PIG-L family deacetylase [Acidimicrobiales bacterium]|nr:PIG-L family deacetylase [Acidimicrobiales bacterium]